MKRLRIYDTNNWARIVLEKDIFGKGIRALWEEAIKEDGIDLKIFAFEGMCGNQARRDKYPDYKLTRKPPQIDSFFDNLDLFKQLLENAPCNVAKCHCDYYEADDVIYSLNEVFKNNYEVSIMSTDRDLTQIENAHFPMVQNELTKREFVRTYKTLVGDTSDNIHGVKGFGKGQWEKEIDNWHLLKQYCEGSLSTFELARMGVSEKTIKLLKETSREEVDILWDITGLKDVKSIMKMSFGNGNIQKTEEKLKELFI